MAIVSKSFRDFSLTFEKNAVTDDVLSLKDEAAIKASVKNIVMYNWYEKPFDYKFGGNIIGLLFENHTPALEQEIAENLEECINFHEPRVTVYDVITDFEPDNNSLDVSISYFIMGIPNRIDNLELAFKP